MNKALCEVDNAQCAGSCSDNSNDIRRAGVLLHPTSLPGLYGSGDLGPSAYAFIDFLSKAKQSYWQVLPLNPVDYCASPYQSPAAFAGNHLLISLELLINDGLLTNADCQIVNKAALSFAQDAEFRTKSLLVAYERFVNQPSNKEYSEFCDKESYWLDDYALFMALKKKLNNLPWHKWNYALARRDIQMLGVCQEILAQDIGFYKFLQYEFFSQWRKLKSYANARGIKIIGDMPIFIAHDSADVWAQPSLFTLDDNGGTEKVAGVPPDYFSATGQLWGNPHYSWEEMLKDDYSWWRARFAKLLALVDIIRVDHFRGFESYWEIPGGAQTAVSGEWRKGPGDKFFKTLEQYLGKIPIIAEDLGIITPEVIALKDQFSFPGMKVLHFALNINEQNKLEFNCDRNCVIYTGTHDNNTTLGWLREDINPAMHKALQKALNADVDDDEQLCWRLIEFAYASAAVIAIIPLQDFLALGSEARMNLPGTTVDNWQWQLSADCLTTALADKIAYVTNKYQRC